jgi:hypothetical protein
VDPVAEGQVSALPPAQSSAWGSVKRSGSRSAVFNDRTAAHTYGIDSPVGRRMARAGAFLRRVGLDLWDSADRWRDLPARPS